MKLFRKEQITSRSHIRKSSQCGSCRLWKNCNSPKMKVSGEGRRKIFVLGEAPGKQEDTKGSQFLDRPSQYLKRLLRKQGIDLDKDCWKHYAVPCLPTDEKGKIRKPTDNEIAYCRPSVIKEIQKRKPTNIVLIGPTALKSFLGERWKKDLGGIDKWRGWAIPDKDFQAWVLPIYSPAHILRLAKKQPVAETIFEQDIRLIGDAIDRQFPILPDADKFCEILRTKEAVSQYLVDVLRYKPNGLAFDYESSGLKPHKRGHRIATVSMCWQAGKAVAWEWKNTDIPLFKRIMENPNIGKIAANMKMEDHWTAVRGRCEVKGWLWDTMQAAHVLDNRKGITSLKFDVYKRFGVTDYSSPIDSYLTSNSKEFGANAFNRVFEAPMGELLLYNCKDGFYTFHLAKEQMKEMGVI